MVPTCGSDGARQSRVQQPQQLGAPTVDATECGCSGRLSRSIRTDDPPFCLDRDIATGAGYVPATSEVVVVSADRAAATPCTRPRRALRNNILKTSQFKTVCVTLACNILYLGPKPRTRLHCYSTSGWFRAGGAFATTSHGLVARTDTPVQILIQSVTESQHALPHHAASTTAGAVTRIELHVVHTCGVCSQSQRNEST